MKKLFTLLAIVLFMSCSAESDENITITNDVPQWLYGHWVNTPQFTNHTIFTLDADFESINARFDYEMAGINEFAFIDSNTIINLESTETYYKAEGSDFVLEVHRTGDNTAMAFLNGLSGVPIYRIE